MFEVEDLLCMNGMEEHRPELPSLNPISLHIPLMENLNMDEPLQKLSPHPDPQRTPDNKVVISLPNYSAQDKQEG